MVRARAGRLIALAALGLAAACITTNPRTSARQEAGDRLSRCVDQAVRPYRGEAARRVCFEEAAAFCRQRGLEPGCALGAAWTDHSSPL